MLGSIYSVKQSLDLICGHEQGWTKTDLKSVADARCYDGKGSAVRLHHGLVTRIPFKRS
jgi:hypothetical protein